MKRIIILAVLLVTILSSCTYKREGEIVKDKEGNYYELTTEGIGAMPSEAYRLHRIDTIKFNVKGFN
jgi:hypothetical protein